MVSNGENEDAIRVDAINHMVWKPSQGDPSATVTYDASCSRKLQQKCQSTVKLSQEVVA